MSSVLFGQNDHTWELPELLARMDKAQKRIDDLAWPGKFLFLTSPRVREAIYWNQVRLGTLAKTVLVRYEVPPYAVRALDPMRCFRNLLIHRSREIELEKVWGRVLDSSGQDHHCLSALGHEKVKFRHKKFELVDSAEYAPSPLFSKPTPIQRAQHMRGCIHTIDHYVGKRDEQDFLRDEIMQEAVMWNLALLGENASKLLKYFESQEKAYLRSTPYPPQRSTEPLPLDWLRKLEHVRCRLVHENLSERPDKVWEQLGDLRGYKVELARLIEVLEAKDRGQAGTPKAG